MPETKKKVSLKPKNHGSKTDKEDELPESNEVESYVDEVEDVDPENDVDAEFDNDHEDEEEPSGTVLEGRVKWFNDRRGYGYITCISEGDYFNSDIFVHHTNIRPQESKYRSLYTNEYVQFHLGQADVAFDENENPVDSDYKHQATHVTGIAGGPLLCDGSYRPSNNQKRNNGRNFTGGSNRVNSKHDDDYEQESSRQPKKTLHPKKFANNERNHRPAKRTQVN